MWPDRKITKLHCVSKKLWKIVFVTTSTYFPSILIIFGRKVVKTLKFCEVHSFCTSPNLHHYTTVLNTDVLNCYTMPKVVICNNFLTTWLAHNKLKCGLFSRIISSCNSLVQNRQNFCSKCAPRIQTQALRRRGHWLIVASSHQQLTDQTVPTHRSEVVWVEGVKMRCCLLFSG